MHSFHLETNELNRTCEARKFLLQQCCRFLSNSSLMKNSCSSIRRLAPITALLLATLIAHAATFTSDTLIGINNTNFDGQDIAVTNCTLTVDGSHPFLSVNLLNGAVLTHSASTNGLLENRLSAAGELQILSSTNPPILNAVAILTNTVVGTNPTGD